MSSSGSNGQPHRAMPPKEWVAQRFAQLELPLLAYVRPRLGGDIEAARDVVQEAFVKLCRQSWPDIEPHATAWLYRVCRNRAIDISRREGRMSIHISKTDVATLGDRAQASPEARADKDEQLERMRNSMHALPDQQQEILRLRLHDGLSYREIAEITGLTVTNVGYHLHQAIAQLRVRMQVE